ncbi:hypothetical protein BCR33DRAFT_785387 [Rhizoclosmatium globosum]|uniref:ABC1 atypical kinase-like domain-containing protein n=1 Tax=Rhizoclosmatium globosum TaxID=329046 RepID=A0A1Y2CAV4_9FUNG|nr:hypothetical protein BCR33DRAFT_785387 [Rhizoclosmatium globosum]|eukprot:ORY44161.1 hypothetical protein BCR33DRAFT_785387 [Rhizoclosmatium globosum]
MGFIDALASLPRRIYIVYLGLIIYGSYKVAKVRLALSKHTDEEEDEGLWVKVGQYMSTRSDVLPEGITEALSVLQDAVPAKPIGETLDTIKTSIGDPQQLFASFDMEALATASIAQVHRAKLKDGQDVVVKVQHKNIASKILRDLSDFETLVWWCAEVPSELDFVKEATNTTEVDEAIRNHNRSLADDKLNPLYLDNGRGGDEADNVDVKELVTSIIKAYAFQIFDLAFHKDFTGLQSALIDLGVKGLTDNVEAEKSMEIVQFIFRSTTTRAEAKAEVEQRRIKREEDAKQKKLNAKAETVKKPKSKIKNASDAFPGVLVFFTRVLFLLRGLSTSLDVNLDYLGVMAPFALNFLERETRAQKFGLLRNQPQIIDKIESGDCLGAQVVAMKRGKVIVDIACGVLGLFDPRPVKSAVTSIALHQQVALGRLAYDDLVSKHWPAFIENLDPSTTTPNNANGNQK